ncbi:hypothetical protein SIN8267_03118 [Sinobacterium norvegicum]|uniref:peptidylprolyl isomerase n=1 Tax=Sinobacterium norvegicum TaxID=1641715 RepID=A0ABM9AID5_9GAMM|nr:peptidylprolyl isomerase [Sinobacterium norvegicum]CAH0992979.1 hypothetical protein SIN8267_03118 [Sinobacterium norvegicum]
MNKLKTLMALPMAQFMAIGLLLFVASEYWLADKPVLLVTADQQQQALSRWRWQQGASPTTMEMSGIINGLIEQELLYQQAEANGLATMPVVVERLAQLSRYVEAGSVSSPAAALDDQQLRQRDPLIRRYLIQSMAESYRRAVEVATPSDSDIEAYYQQHYPTWLRPPRVAVSHAYFGGLSASSKSQAEQLVQRLMADETMTVEQAIEQGRAFYNGHQLPLKSESQLAALFGAEAAQQILLLPTGQWSAAVASSYGWHVFYPTSRQIAAAKLQAQVAFQIRSQLDQAAREQGYRETVAELLAQYEVVVEPIDSGEVLAYVAD